MVVFKLLLLSYFGFASHVLHAVSDRKLVVVGEKHPKPPKIDRGRKRTAKVSLYKNTLSKGRSYFFDLIQRPRITAELVIETYTPKKGQYPDPNPLLMLESKKKKPMETSTLVSFGSGIAITWALHMLLEWFAGRKNRHNQAQAPHTTTEHFVPLFQAWPLALLRTMKPATLRQLLRDQYATAINLETLLEALDPSPLVSSFRDYKLSTLLTEREEDVIATTGISQDQCEYIFNGARYLRDLSTQRFMID